MPKSRLVAGMNHPGPMRLQTMLQGISNMTAFSHVNGREEFLQMAASLTVRNVEDTQNAIVVLRRMSAQRKVEDSSSLLTIASHVEILLQTGESCISCTLSATERLQSCSKKQYTDVGTIN